MLKCTDGRLNGRSENAPNRCRDRAELVSVRLKPDAYITIYLYGSIRLILRASPGVTTFDAAHVPLRPSWSCW